MPPYDFLVIGSGPAGLRGAIQAAKLGKRVALVERWPRVGGVSVHTGTLPSKTLREAMLYLSGFRQRAIYGADYRLKQEITAADLMRRLNVTIDHEVDVLHAQLARNGVEIIPGTASFVNAHRVRVASADNRETVVDAQKILIATGTRPRRPAEITFRDGTVVDSDGILQITRLPKHLVVVGAGVIGMEYATMFNALGCEVTVVNEKIAVMEYVDRDIKTEFLEHLKTRGLHLRVGVPIKQVRCTIDAGVTVEFANGDTQEADMLLYAAGRIGCTTALAVENAGLTATDRHFIKVNDHYQTAVPHIYAAGDVVGFPSLASVSMEQGRRAACHAFDQPQAKARNEFPLGIYTVPEISQIGRSEQELIAQNVPYVVGRAKLTETARGQIRGVSMGLLKLIFQRDTRQLLGVHIVGESATELVHIGEAVLQLNGTLDYFVENVFNYPTFAEAYKMAGLDAWNKLNGRGQG